MDQEIGLSKSNDDDPYTVRARLLSERVLAFLPQAAKTLMTFRSVGPELRSPLSAIQAQVTMAVLANTENVSELTQQLGTALPAIGGKVIGVTLPSVPPATLMQVIRAIARHENGVTPPYAEVQFKAAMKLLG